MKRIKLDDTVIVISGREKGKQGTVLEISSKKDAVCVNGVSLVSKHQKQKAPMSGAPSKFKGVRKVESWIPLSKVMPFCSQCDKAARVVVKMLELGQSSRACSRCKQVF